MESYLYKGYTHYYVMQYYNTIPTTATLKNVISSAKIKSHVKLKIIINKTKNHHSGSPGPGGKTK